MTLKVQVVIGAVRVSRWWPQSLLADTVNCWLAIGAPTVAYPRGRLTTQGQSLKVPKRLKIKKQDAGPHDAGPAEPDRLHLEPVHWTTLASQDFHLRANWGKDCQDAGEEDDEEHLEHLESRQMHPNQGRIEARAPGEQADGRRAPLL